MVDADITLDEVTLNGGDLKVKFTIKNIGSEPLDVSGLGVYGQIDETSTTDFKGGRLMEGESQSGIGTIKIKRKGQKEISVGKNLMLSWVVFKINIKE